MDRLSAQDLSTLWPDAVGWPQDIGALAILDGPRLLEPDGRLRLDVLRTAIESRLHLIPRFRQVPYAPRRGLGRPLWVDVQRFDIANHVNVVALPAPAGEGQLVDTVEELRRRPLSHDRPLWHLWFLTGLPGGRVGMYMKVHHVIADGVAGVALLSALLDVSPVVPPGAVHPWEPDAMPSARELAADNIGRGAAAIGRALATLARPITTARRVRDAWPAVNETFGAPPVPRTSFNRPLGPGRKLVLVRERLDDAKQIAHAYGATVNDVLLTGLCGGLRTVLAGRGELHDGLTLRAYVPVALHRGPSGNARGNHDGVMVVPLPVGEANPAWRLKRIAELTAERKRRSRPAAGTLLRNGLTQRAFLRVMARQRWANVYAANVPGPPTPLYLAGARIVEVFPLVPLIGNVTIGIGALSYAGQFNITAVTDSAACPEADVFADGVRDTLHDLASDLVDQLAVRGA